MARWKLITAHYLFGYPPGMDGEPIEWEYKEQDRATGRERRKRFKVPFYMDENSIVCHEGKGLESDIVFEGPPTHDMIPLDAEAKALSAKLPSAKYFEQDFPSQGPGGFSGSMLGKLEEQLTALVARVGVPTAVPAVQAGVSKEQFDQLQAQVMELMAQNAKLMEQLVGGQQVIDDEEPLPPDGVVEPLPAPTQEAPRRSL